MKTPSLLFAFCILLLVTFTFSFVLLWEMAVYDRLDLLDQKVNRQWAQAEKAYRLQSSLIPKLMNEASASGFLKKSELNEITAAHASVERAHIKVQKAPKDAAKLAEFEKAQEALSWTLEKFFITVEYNSKFAIDKNFQNLRKQFEKAQNKIVVERDHFNKTVQIYNAAIKFIPGANFLKILGKHNKPFLNVAENSQSFLKKKSNFENAEPLFIID